MSADWNTPPTMPEDDDLAGLDAELADAEAAPKPNGKAPDEADAAWRLLDDVEVMNLPDPEFIVEGVIVRRGKAAIWGPPGGYKTTLIAGLLVAVATGRNWFGHTITHKGISLYVGAEDVSGFKRRLKAAKVAAGLSLEKAVGVYTFPDAIDLRNPANVGRFLRFVQRPEIAFEIVVVDTYAAATPGAAENSSEDTTAAMAAAQRIGDTLKTTVILVHHSNAAGTRERGHTAMKGSVDTMIQVEPIDDVVHVRCDKQRNGAPFETLTLKPVPVPTGPGVVLRFAADVLPTSVLTDTQIQVLSVLRDIAGTDGVSKSSWRQACPSVSERTFYKVANVLEARQYVVKGGTHFRLGRGPQ